MDYDEHKKRHLILNYCLDELVADFIRVTGRPPAQVTVLELMTWSYHQTLRPQGKEDRHEHF